VYIYVNAKRFDLAAYNIDELKAEIFKRKEEIEDE